MATTIDVYIESGKQRVMACAVDWPGWCRVGRTEQDALETLFAYAGRYAHALSHAQSGFVAPSDLSELRVVARVEGGTTTDFGAPQVISDFDRRPFDHEEQARSAKLLRAYWRAFDHAVNEAEGKTLRKGPRGGGRERDDIMLHVAESEAGYLKSLAQKPPKLTGSPSERLEQNHAAILAALETVVTQTLPERGPRGGTIWTPRYFVRRVGWHVLDHAWEIEDRQEETP